MNSESKIEPKERPSVLRVLVTSLMVTVASAFASVICTTFIVPRRSEGLRDVPNVSWATYALIGNGIAILLSLLILGFVFRSRHHKVLAWVVASVVCYIAHLTFLTALLQRDFNGKF